MSYLDRVLEFRDCISDLNFGEDYKGKLPKGDKLTEVVADVGHDVEHEEVREDQNSTHLGHDVEHSNSDDNSGNHQKDSHDD